MPDTQAQPSHGKSLRASQKSHHPGKLCLGWPRHGLMGLGGCALPSHSSSFKALDSWKEQKFLEAASRAGERAMREMEDHCLRGIPLRSWIFQLGVTRFTWFWTQTQRHLKDHVPPIGEIFSLTRGDGDTPDATRWSSAVLKPSRAPSSFTHKLGDVSAPFEFQLRESEDHLCWENLKR